MDEVETYLETITEQGFVDATRETIAQVIANKATIDQLNGEVAKLRGEMTTVLAALGKRLEKLEKPPK